jgi:hypothetical protein
VSLRLKLSDPVICLPTAVTNKKAFSENNVMSELPAAVHKDQLATQPFYGKVNKSYIKKIKFSGGKKIPWLRPTCFLFLFIFIFFFFL